MVCTAHGVWARGADAYDQVIQHPQNRILGSWEESSLSGRPCRKVRAYVLGRLRVKIGADLLFRNCGKLLPIDTRLWTVTPEQGLL